MVLVVAAATVAAVADAVVPVQKEPAAAVAAAVDAVGTHCWSKQQPRGK
jgi:hypothetical protein